MNKIEITKEQLFEIIKLASGIIAYEDESSSIKHSIISKLTELGFNLSVTDIYNLYNMLDQSESEYYDHLQELNKNTYD